MIDAEPFIVDDTVLSMDTINKRIAHILTYTHKLLIGKKFRFDITDTSLEMHYDAILQENVNPAHGYMTYVTDTVIIKKEKEEVEMSICNKIAEKFTKWKFTYISDLDDYYDGEEPEEEDDEELDEKREKFVKQHLNQQYFAIAATKKENLSLLMSEKKTKPFAE